MKPIIIFLIIISSLSISQNKNAVFQKSQHPTGAPSASLLNINRISAWYSGNGESERNPNTGNSGVSYPRGTAYAIYASGIMMGGFVSDGLQNGPRVTGFSYNTGFLPGAIKGIRTGQTEDPNQADVRVYRIRKDYATADLKQDAAELNGIDIAITDSNHISAVKNQYKKDWTEWPVEKGAPFYDSDNDGKYAPKFEIKNGKEVPIHFPLADEPGLAGADQVLWYVANDLRPQESPWKTKAIGLELQVTIWGYNYASNHGLGNSIFKRNRIIYKGGASTPANSKMTEFYIGQWSDPDLGDAGDDFVGCDSALGVGYVYNSITLDAVYKKFNLSAPAAGYILLQGPTIKSSANDYAQYDFGWKNGFKNIPMTSFVSFSTGILPVGCEPPWGYGAAIQFYQTLRGLPATPQGPPDPGPFIDPTTQKLTKFVASGDPVTNTGWIDGKFSGFDCTLGIKPGDRRLLTSSGPFEMAVGDTQEVVYALTAALGSDHLTSITAMKFFMRQSREYFNYLFPDNPASVNDDISILPKTFMLSQNYPNPFNPGTSIQFELPVSGFTTLTIYDALGRETERLISEQKGAGLHFVQWNAKERPSGVYYYRLHSGNYIQTRKMILVK